MKSNSQLPSPGGARSPKAQPPGETENLSNPSQMRILLVEDHPSTREGLCNAINSQPLMTVVGEASSWHSALTLARTVAPNIMILDLNLPDGNGWTLLEQLLAQNALPPTLVLSVCDESLYARRLLRAGARGYLMKDEPISRVLSAIREIHAGGLVASPVVTTSLMSEALSLPTDSESPASHASGLLSDRELQVCELFSRNLTNKEVASSLGLSEKTIHTYKVRLMAKLVLQTTPELVAWFLSSRLPGSH